jgi:hypothetical protein
MLLVPKDRRYRVYEINGEPPRSDGFPQSNCKLSKESEPLTRTGDLGGVGAVGAVVVRLEDTAEGLFPYELVANSQATYELNADKPVNTYSCFVAAICTHLDGRGASFLPRVNWTEYDWRGTPPKSIGTFHCSCRVLDVARVKIGSLGADG